ncbi:hypothetical protein NIES267_56060 [Calothrix parasitica NIES-267]|uniref:HTH cro/C1-type domain-containing protein n=1 Tax=Calothrix parasitica NIES-267 TaxID=1973488 RepID=A0A1Z4LY28_9CYAN|nr:hypothetical protein NIES267_56060 [Calothrix parasitica NIES-267]
MSSGDNERRQRLSVLCKRLRGNESLRSFTKKRSHELKGISHASWSSWESERAGLSTDSLDRLASFIGCSHQSLFAYLDGSITIDELLQPTSTSDIKVNKDSLSALSPDAAAVWMKSLSLKDKLLVASQGFQLFQDQLDELVEQKAKELIEEEAQLLIDLLSGDDYPCKAEITRVADKFNLKTEDLIKLCSRIYSKSKEY